MRQLMLLYVAILILSYHALQATETMAKNTGMRCNQCHKGRNIVPGVKPKLKVKGIRHLTKLITIKGYVPKYKYSKLNYLAAQIEENRKKLETPKKSKVEDLEDKNNLATKPQSVNETSMVANRSNASSENPKEIIPKVNTLENKALTNSKLDESKAVRPTFEKTIIRKKKEQLTKKSSGKTKNVVVSPEGKVKFKGGKTFILKRPKVKPGTKYNWEQDWSFDDYY
tara:strand:+ start:140 stop:817 length:678 start_codon:yes stop_codon:yes gene_type:complete